VEYLKEYKASEHVTLRTHCEAFNISLDGSWDVTINDKFQDGYTVDNAPWCTPERFRI